MGTAVLQAQDCLNLHRKNKHHGFTAAIYYGGAKSPSNYEPAKKSQSHRKKAAHGSSPQKPCNPKGATEFPEKKRPFKSGEFHGDAGKRSLKNQNQNLQRREQSQPKDFPMGAVTILKRGQSIESKGHMMGRLGVSPPKSGATAEELFTGRRIMRSVSAGFDQPESVKFAEEWAGPGFSNSPSPRCLPLPNFPVKKTSKDAVAQIDNCATRDLRRLLGLD